MVYQLILYSFPFSIEKHSAKVLLDHCPILSLPLQLFMQVPGFGNRSRGMQ